MKNPKKNHGWIFGAAGVRMNLGSVFKNPPNGPVNASPNFSKPSDLLKQESKKNHPPVPLMHLQWLYTEIWVRHIFSGVNW